MDKSIDDWEALSAGQHLGSGSLENRLQEVLKKLIASTDDHSNDRKTVVRWFNRLVYEIGIWNGELLSLLDEYDPQHIIDNEKSVYNLSLWRRFDTFVRAIDLKSQPRLPQLAELTEDAHNPTALDICGRITFLQQRFHKDFAWLEAKDSVTYNMLLSAINDTVNGPGYSYGPKSELAKKLSELGKAIFGGYPYPDPSDSVDPNEAKLAIMEYRKWSIKLIEQLSRRAQDVGISLLSIREYEDALHLHQEGLSNSSLYVIGEVAMSADTYNVGQAGAVGSGATAQQFSMQQVWQQNAGQFNLEDLASELSTLRSAMRSQASETEHDIAIGAVAAAETAATAGDGAMVLSKLKEAGKWTFDVATKIGVSVAAAAIKTALKI